MTNRHPTRDPTSLKDEMSVDVRACVCLSWLRPFSCSSGAFTFLIDDADNRHNTKRNQQQWQVLPID